MAYREGQWTRRERVSGTDSHLFSIRNNRDARLANVDRISLGSVLLPQPEPLYRQHAVTVELVTGGIITNVAWPGAQVNANATGTIPGGVTLGIHGLWESPLSGQMVLLGFVDGSSGNPIILNKYPYNASSRPDLEVNHTLPLTAHAIGPTDIVLGHHTGSFLALRGTLPLPAEIDIYSMSAITITALAFMSVVVTAQYTETVGGAFSNTTGGQYEVTAGAKIAFTAVGKFEATGGAGLDLTAIGAMSLTGTTISISSSTTLTISGVTTSITSSGAPLTITATPAVVINSGTRAVAAMGDLTPTLLGPSPIVATGIACLVP